MDVSLLISYYYSMNKVQWLIENIDTYNLRMSKLITSQEVDLFYTQ